MIKRLLLGLFFCLSFSPLNASFFSDVKINDEYGFKVENTPQGEMRTVTPVMLVGKTFEGNLPDPNFFQSSTTVNGSTITQANSELCLKTWDGADSFTKVWSIRRARYIAGASMSARTQVVLSSGVDGNTRKWGVGYGASTPTITDGAYFQLKGTTLGVVTLRDGIETVIQSGNFNGDLGTTYLTTNTVQTYEIYWNNRQIFFVIGDKILHTVTASTQTNMGTVQPRLYAENSNYSVIGTTTSLCFFVVSIRRLGELHSQSVSYYQSGQTAGVVLKYGLGEVHEVSLSGVSNSSVVTLYDNTSASGKVLWSSGSMGSQTTPFSIPLNFPFFTGLTLSVTGASSNVAIGYE